MELAKSIISAKKRGETVPNSLNPNLEKQMNILLIQPF